MKKLSKLLAALLALIMMLSVFTACGDDKKDDKDDRKKSEKTSDVADNEEEEEDEEEAPTGEELLIGEWTTDIYYDSISVALSLIFEDDGTAYFDLTRDSYDDMIDAIIEMEFEGITDEEIAEEDYASRAEAEDDVRESLIQLYPYEDFVAAYVPDFELTWELDGDTLTIESDDGGISTAETKLSEGRTTFTLVNSESYDEAVFTKAD